MAKKKVVRVESTGKPGESNWKPTPEAKSKATLYRVIAVVLWLLAIAGEVFTIFYILKQNPVNMVWLIGAIVIIGILAVVGNLLWKKANVLDPASRSDPVRFFIQNQLGAILAIIAFLPLIIMILLNQNMSKQQKGIASAVGVVVLAVATILGISFNPPSVEQYTEEVAVVMGYTGQDLVFWTKEGSVYHLCAAVSDLQLESKDNQIYSGTVAQAHEAGKERLTLKVETELKQCGINVTPVPTKAP